MGRQGGGPPPRPNNALAGRQVRRACLKASTTARSTASPAPDAGGHRPNAWPHDPSDLAAIVVEECAGPAYPELCSGGQFPDEGPKPEFPMRKPLALLKFVAKALGNALGGGIA